MPNEEAIIMTPRKFGQKLERMAYEIFEDNYNEKELLIAGINTKGYFMADKLAERLRAISPIEVALCNVRLDPSDPVSSPVSVDLPYEITGKSIIVVDDVANTGRTLMYALKPFLKFTPKKIKLAVLVDREHKRYPVFCDFVGLSLSTTFHEHVEVNLNGREFESVALV